MSLHKSNIAIQGLPVWFEVPADQFHMNANSAVRQVQCATQALGSVLEKTAVKEVSRALSPKVTLVPVPLDLLREIANFGELSAEGRVFRKLQANLRQWIDAHV